MVLYIKGKATIVEAIIVAVPEKTIDLSKVKSIFPIRPFFPNITSKKNPTTVGGKTSGRVNNPSTIPFVFFNLKVKYAL